MRALASPFRFFSVPLLLLALPTRYGSSQHQSRSKPFFSLSSQAVSSPVQRLSTPHFSLACQRCACALPLASASSLGYSIAAPGSTAPLLILSSPSHSVATPCRFMSCLRFSCSIFVCSVPRPLVAWRSRFTSHRYIALPSLLTAIPVQVVAIRLASVSVRHASIRLITVAMPSLAAPPLVSSMPSLVASSLLRCRPLLCGARSLPFCSMPLRLNSRPCDSGAPLGLATPPPVVSVPHISESVQVVSVAFPVPAVSHRLLAIHSLCRSQPIRLPSAPLNSGAFPFNSDAPPFGAFPSPISSGLFHCVSRCAAPRSSSGYLASVHVKRP